VGVLGPRVQALQSCTTVADDRRTSEAELTAALQLRLRTLPGTYSVSVRELEGLQASVSIRGAVAQEPVSVIKVFVAYAALDRIERGLLSFTTLTRSGVSVGECMRVMIHISDNYCHHDLVALLGVSALSAQLRAEGYVSTVYSGAGTTSVPYSSKLTSTDDLALLLSRLNRGELLNPELTAHFMTLLETQLWRSKIPSGVEAGVPVGNKTGSAWSQAGWFHSDAGIVSAPSGDYVIAVLGSGGATEVGVREISRIVYEHFNGPITTPGTFSELNGRAPGATTYYRSASTSTPLGTIPAGTVVAIDSSVRTWYLVSYNGEWVYVRSSTLANAVDYPRSG
jgi:beta-lactamase class A